MKKITMSLFLVAALVLPLVVPTDVAGEEALNWVYKELTGTWKTDGTDATFQYQGGAVFRFNTTSSDTLFARWNGRQLRVTGPVHTDERGWTYFQIDGTQCRMGRKKGGVKVVEVQGDRGQVLQMPAS